MNYICRVEIGSNGGPILNLMNNKVIGMSIITNDNCIFNIGIFFKYPIEQFINNYQIKLTNQPQIPNMFNNNFMNMGMNNFIPNMMVNNNYFPNMMLNNNNFEIQNLMNKNNLFGQENTEGKRNVNNNIKGKTNVSFHTSRGKRIVIIADYGTTNEQILKQYLKRFDLPESLLIQEKIIFIYNANKINIGDKTPVEKFFNYSLTPSPIFFDI